MFLIIFRILVFEIYDLSLSLQSDNYKFNDVFEKITFNNVILILYYILKSIFMHEIVLFCIPFFIIFLLNIKKDKKLLFIFIYFILNYLFIFSAYLFNNEHLEFMLKTGLNRILFESSSIYILFPIIYHIHLKRERIKIPNPTKRVSLLSRVCLTQNSFQQM